MANVALHELTDSWSGGGAFDAIKMSVTDGGSTADSKLLDLLVGGASKFSVSKAGNVAAAGTLTVTGASTLAALGATNGTFSGTLGVTGAATLSSTLAVTGNTTLSGTLGVTGLGTFNAGISRCGPAFDRVAIGEGAKARAAAVTAIGYQALGVAADQDYTGISNTAVGWRAGKDVTTATQSVFVGSSAGPAVTTGGSNVLIGHGAGFQLTTGARNQCIGTFAGRGQNFGDDNILIGFNSARDITGSSNIVLKSSTSTTGYLDDLAGTNQINIGDRYFHDRIQLRDASAGAGDCVIRREAADTLALRRATNAQTLRLYNTYTDASNYERGYLDWSSNVMRLGTQKLGSGTARALVLQTDGTTRVSINAAGNVGIGTTTPATLLHVSGAGASNTGTILLDDPTTPTGLTASGPHFFMKSGGSNRGWVGFYDSAPHGNGTQLNLKSAGAIGFANGTGSANAMTLTGGSLGIGTTAPGRRLDVNDASGNCLRLTHNDADGSATNFCDFLVSSGGDLTIDPSGGDVIVDGALGATNGTFSGTLGVTGATTFSSTINAVNVGAYQGGSNTAIAITASTSPNLALCGQKSVLIGYQIAPNIDAGSLANANNTVGIGHQTLFSLTTGNNNTAIGSGALANVTTGGSNTAVGVVAGQLQTGSYNISIGRGANSLQTSGDYNIVLGAGPAGAYTHSDSTTGSYQINIGNRYYHDRIQLKNAASGAGDCILIREAANALAMRNGINAQTFRLYNTWTDASNYERGYLRWDADILKIGTEEAGSGTARALELQTDGTTRVTIGATGFVGLRGAPTNNVPLSIYAADFNAITIRNTESTAQKVFALSVGKPNFYDDIFCIKAPDEATPGIRINAAGKFQHHSLVEFYATANFFVAPVIADNVNVVFSTGANGNKLGTSTNQKIAFWNKTPIVQPTTAHAEATFVENSGGTAVNVDSTFGGYTLQQVVKALQDVGLLA